ncbi:AAA family ATPase [Halpernia frigidisoli]|uniref:AAA domain (Dynein-related subfamily) n=1 Tax=Halpernia frigidisoli TaxID=1125876 RepID=A0A1I3CUE8_9FLAO|nr:AAA family ATPase [Halpernia frigidisoli]SFH77998.1 AAA domain (dynein-related subfamily) [Halpernia frigidisoli]
METTRSQRTSKSQSQKKGNIMIDFFLDQHLEDIKNKIAVDLLFKIEKDFEQRLRSNLGRVNSEIKKLITNKDLINEDRKNLHKEIVDLKTKLDSIRNYKTISIKIQHDDQLKDLGAQHYQFSKLLQYVQTKNNVFMVGSAGSGKTTAAENIAKALNLEFYFTGAITSEFKLTGFMNAHGQIVSTQFRKAYEEGGVFLFDEIDASFPQAILAFNAALANKFMDFPDGRINRHKDFYCIAAANTFGTGADRKYVGRNQLDAASLDRFIFLSWEIDENLEHQLANNTEWTNYVQKVRKAVAKISERVVVSPRASMIGAELLQLGISREEVEQDVLWKGLDASRIKMIKNNI